MAVVVIVGPITACTYVWSKNTNNVLAACIGGGIQLSQKANRKKKGKNDQTIRTYYVAYAYTYIRLPSTPPYLGEEQQPWIMFFHNLHGKMSPPLNNHLPLSSRAESSQVNLSLSFGGLSIRTKPSPLAAAAGCLTDSFLTAWVDGWTDLVWPNLSKIKKPARHCQAIWKSTISWLSSLFYTTHLR